MGLLWYGHYRHGEHEAVMTGYSIIDGEKFPNTVVTADQTLTGLHQIGVEVLHGTLTIDGTLQASLSISDGAAAIVNGLVQGSVSISGSGKLVVFGKVQGSVKIASDAEVVIESAGSISGSMQNAGSLIIRGAFGGAYGGNGHRSMEGDGYIKQPRIENGTHYYDW